MSKESELRELIDLYRQEGNEPKLLKALEAYDSLKVSELPKKPISEQLKRQAGLGARYAVEGLTGVADIFTEPMRATANLFGADIPQSTTGVASGLLTKAGLPQPESKSEHIAGTGSKFLSGGGGFIQGGKLLAKAPGLINQTISKGLISNPTLQGASATTAGIGGETAKQEGAGPTGQLAASLISGLVPSTARHTAVKATPDALKPLFGGVSDEMVASTIQKAGISLNDMTLAAKTTFKEKVREALELGNLDDQALKVVADYYKTNTVPTKGSVTLDPGIVTQQRNIAKTGINTGNATAQKLAQIEHQNERSLLEGINDLGATSYEKSKGGEAIKQVINEKNTALKAEKNAIYQEAKDIAGKEIPLDRNAFIELADKNLRESRKGAFLPAEVKDMLNEVAYGQKTIKGEIHEVPFNVSIIDQFETTLANAMRKAKGDPNARMAIGAVKDALVKSPVEGDLPSKAMGLLRQGRDKTRELYSWQESGAGVKGVMDDLGSDVFMRKHILNESADTREAQKIYNEIKDNPEALQTVKNQIISFIKYKTLNKKPDETGKVSSTALNAVIDSLGAKLKIFFTPDEIKQLKAINRVAMREQYQPSGSAINNSNTTGALLGQIGTGMNSLMKNSPGIGKMWEQGGIYLDAKPLLNPSLAQKVDPQYKWLAPAMYGSGLLNQRER